jgi:DNA gyrase subunit A
VHYEEAGGGKALIIVTELPYQVNKASLIEKIAELVRDKRIDSLSDLRDESDRQGMRIVLELKRGLEPQPTLMQLYKYTPMQSNFNVNLLALVDGEPRVLSLKRTLQLFIEHRQEVIIRRSRFDLERAKLRAHILQGLIVALDHLDEVIDTIRRSQTADTALKNLMHKFKLTEIQARAILDLQLRRLAALERHKIEEEYADVLKLIKYLEALLHSPRKILGLIKTELQELKTRFGDARRTRISEKEAEQISVEDLVPEQDVLLVVSQRSYVNRVSRRSDVLGKSKDPARHVIATNTLHSAIFCTNQGHCFTTRVHQIPDSQATGVPLSNLLTLQADEAVVAVVNVPDFGQAGFLTLCTALGKIKRTAIEEFSAIRSSGLSGITLEEGDELRWARLTDGNQEILLITANGQALRFKEAEVRAMGRSAAGVNAIKLGAKDRLVHMDIVESGAAVLVVTDKGYGKRTPLSEYPTQSRYAQGVATYSKASPQTGSVVAAQVVQDHDNIAILCASGNAFPLHAEDVPQQGRSTRGTLVVQPKDKDRVESVVRVAAVSKPSPPATEQSAKKPAKSSRPKSEKPKPLTKKRPAPARRSPAAGKAKSTQAAKTGQKTSKKRPQRS